MKINEKELKQLFEEIKQDKKVGFEKLYNKYNKLVYCIAFSILKNKEDAEDIVQTVFAKIYNSKKENLPTNKEASWLYTVTKNEALTLIKKNKKFEEIDLIYEIQDSNDEINKIIDKDEYNRLIDRLNNKEKEVISLKLLANLSFREIGDLLNEPTGTVKWRYYRATNALKILLGNLAMFIITFVIGLRELTQEQQIIKTAEEEKNTNETTETTEVTEKDEQNNDERHELDSSVVQDNSIENTENTEIIQEEIVQEEIVQNETINETKNIGIGILSISGMFLIITIAFMVIIIKRNLKNKKKNN